MNPPNCEPNNPFPPPPHLPMSADPLSFPERKGKDPSNPLQIPSSSGADTAQNDLFSISLDSDSPPVSSLPGPSSSHPAIQHEFTTTLQKLASQHDLDALPYDTELPYLDKGKATDSPPVLPPLTFPPMSFDICPSPSLISEPGPSSYGSLCPPRIEHDSPSYTPPALHTFSTHGMVSMLSTALPRRRSFSNPHLRHPDHLIASSSAPTRAKTESSRSPSELSHRRPPSDRRQTRSVPSSPGVGVQVPINLDAVETSSCLAPWKREFKPRLRDKSRSYSCLVPDRVGGGSTGALPARYPVHLATRPVAELHTRQANVRSYSDPFPLPHAFDLVPADTADAFVPIPIINPPNLFDGMLPREIRLRIFGFLVEIHEEDHTRRVREGRWTANKASKLKWVGRNQGVRELMRLTRVCKAWLTLIHDGQLWSNLDLRAFPKMPASQLLQVAESAGSFITSFNLSGHGGLLSSTVEGLASSLSVTRGMRVASSHNQLTYLNMSGCSMVTTSSLHRLLSQSPFLETSSLKGMPAVTNETCEILFKHCPRLTSLDLSRCKNLTGAGIQSFASSAVLHAKLLPLVELRLSGLKGATDSMMTALGNAAPHLEVLDLSYCKDLHNSSLDAFVACTEDFTLDSVSLTARQAGRNPNDGRRYHRRITRLRHLSLSSCTLLTDIACSHLAYATPQLELLELGGIGGELKDAGIIRLLQTLPNIRKLDLEDASDITDNVLLAITPFSPSDDITQDHRVPGHALEHLIVSYAVQLSNDAILALMQNCTRLRILEADGTRLSVASVKEFVKLARERNAQDATIVAVDCRSVNEATVKELTDSIRPRLGWRAYEARRLAYLDGRDDEALGVGQDECEPQRVVLKTFASWQIVDAVAAARKRRKGWRRRDANVSGTSGTEDALASRSRWWSPGGRRSSGMSSPSLLDTNNERDGCTIM